MIIQTIRIFLFLIPLCVGIVQAADKPMEFVGEFSHIVSTAGGHCRGYSVMLWKHQDSLVGLLDHLRGLCGDPPMGILVVNYYSASTGILYSESRI